MGELYPEQKMYLRKFELVIFFEVIGVSSDEILWWHVLDGIEFKRLGIEHGFSLCFLFEALKKSLVLDFF